MFCDFVGIYRDFVCLRVFYVSLWWCVISCQFVLLIAVFFFLGWFRVDFVESSCFCFAVLCNFVIRFCGDVAEFRVILCNFVAISHDFVRFCSILFDFVWIIMIIFGFRVKIKVGTLCIPCCWVCLLSRYSLGLPCGVCLEIKEEQLYSFRARWRLRARLVPRWEISWFSI